MVNDSFIKFQNFGFNVVIGESQTKVAAGERVLPTAFMPPLYLYFIYFVKNLSNEYLQARYCFYKSDEFNIYIYDLYNY